MLAASCGETRSSASRHSTQSCAACSTANCFCRPKPSHSFCTTRAPLARRDLGGAVAARPSRPPRSRRRRRRCRGTARAAAAALRVMRTAERGFTGRGSTGDENQCGDSAILANATCRESSSSRLPRSATSSTTVRRSPMSRARARRGDRLGGRGAVRRRRRDASGGAARDPGGGAPLARGAVAPAVWSEIGGMAARAARERYDAVIDTQGLLKSALIAALGARPAPRPGPRQRARAVRARASTTCAMRCRAACTRWSGTAGSPPRRSAIQLRRSPRLRLARRRRAGEVAVLCACCSP